MVQTNNLPNNTNSNYNGANNNSGNSDGSQNDNDTDGKKFYFLKLKKKLIVRNLKTNR